MIEELQPITLKDKSIITEYFAKHNFLSCEQNFSNIFSWQDNYPVTWAKFNDKGDIVLYYEGENIILLPNHDLSPEELFFLCSDLNATSGHIRVENVSKKYLQKYLDVEKYFVIEQNIDFSEYIYCAEKLVNLKGKKLRKKKSHIKKFYDLYRNQGITVKNLHGFQLHGLEQVNFNNMNLAEVEYNSSNEDGEFQHCLEFLEKYFSLKGEMPTDKEDFAAIKSALNNYKMLSLDGITIYVAGKMVAFSLFSRQNSQAFTIHFEKINHNFIGASQFLNYCTAIYLLKKFNCKYINREQDLGITGLRHSKRSYDPEFMLEHYSLITKDNCF